MFFFRNILTNAQYFLILVILLFSINLFSQKSEPVEILSSNIFRFKKIEGQNVKILTGKVKLKQGATLINCDSLIEFAQPRMMKMYKKVVVKYDQKTTVNSDYLEYYPDEGQAFFRNNVVILKDKFKLTTSSAEYAKQEDIFIYDKPGKFTQDKTVLDSDKGKYEGKSKMSFFYGNVKAQKENKSTITADSLQYDGEEDKLILIAQTIIKDSTHTLYASKGYLSNSENSGVNFLYNRPRIVDSTSDAIADTIKYFKATNITHMLGKASIFDLKNRIKITGDSIFVNRYSGEFYASRNPVAYSYRNADDPFVIRADYIYSNRYINDSSAMKVFSPIHQFSKAKSIGNKIQTIKDSSSIFLEDTTSNKAKGIKTTTTKVKSLDVMPAPSFPSDGNIYQQQKTATQEIYQHFDSSDRYFIAYHNVRAYSDTLQAYCDSLYFSSVDSVIRMIDQPILWVSENQMTGDSIYIHVVEKSLDVIHIPAKGLIVKQEFDTLYNQARAGSITYYYNQRNNTKDSILLIKNVNMAYFVTDSSNSYISFDRSESENAVIYMTESRKLGQVKYLKNYKGDHYPPNKIPEEVLYLSQFQVFENVRPKSVEYIETYIDTLKMIKKTKGSILLKKKNDLIESPLKQKDKKGIPYTAPPRTFIFFKEDEQRA